MKGKKTYLGIIMLILAALGLTDKISNADVGILLDSVLKIIGTILAIYGRYEASQNLTAVEAKLSAAQQHIIATKVATKKKAK